MRALKYVAVIGPGAAEATAEQIALAEEVGSRVASELNAVVVCGGLGGVMAAAARGASNVGGQSLGILPGTDHIDGNDYLTLSVPTGLGELRDGLVVRSAQAVIAVGGNWGTTAEIALAIKLGKPVVSLIGWRFSDGNGRPAPGVHHVDSVRDAIQFVRGRLAGQATT